MMQQGKLILLGIKLNLHSNLARAVKCKVEGREQPLSLTCIKQHNAST